MDEVELARQLVAIPSHEDESEAGDYIGRWLREHTDATVDRGEYGVIARRGGDAPGDSLALVGHHDVVPPEGSQIREDGGYVVEERGGRLYGRGSADMKGSLAAAMVAFRDATPDCELRFASFAGEERGGVGAQAAIEAGFAPDYAVVGEGSTGYSAPGVTDVAVAHKGRRGATVTATGRAAHASEPAAGENAVYRAGDAVDVVRGLEAPTAAVLGHELRGSVAVTEIEGGSAWNVIPDRCAVTVDERTVPGERAPLERVEAVEGVTLEIDQELPPMACEDGDFADLVVRAARPVQRGEPRQVVKPHATDAGWLAEAGTTCVVCGAAEPGEAHTAEESVSLDAVRRCERIYRGVAERL
jgi:acetylornithine deacetylase